MSFYQDKNDYFRGNVSCRPARKTSDMTPKQFKNYCDRNRGGNTLSFWDVWIVYAYNALLVLAMIYILCMI